MKAMTCGACGDIRALRASRESSEVVAVGPHPWVTCECGSVSARWVDPFLGTAEFKGAREFGFILGLHNGVLIPALRGELAMFQDFREEAERATDAPGYVFDKSKCGAWAVIVRAGVTDDVSWIEEET